MSADILYEKKTWNVGDLKTKIEASSSSFTRFTVVRITHVKDLANWVWHEYIQVIVRDSDTSKLIRLIAERQTDNDHLIIGRWKAWKEGDTPPDGDGDTNYPLALLTLEFNNTRPSLETFVWLLSALHDLQPKYNVLTANCYWYALAVYYNLFTWYKNTATERKWTWWFYRYLPPSYILWWDCVTVPLMRIAASAFKSDDMKDKSNPKIITFDRAKIPHSGNTTDHPPNPVAVAFWLAIQQRGAKKTETNQSTAVAPTLPTRNLTAEEIQANLPVASQFAGTPNPVSYPDGITGPNYPFVEQVHNVCAGLLQDPLREVYLKLANEQGFDEIFTPLSVKNTPPEYKAMLDAVGPEMVEPGSQLTEQDCDDLNKSLKACVGAVQMKVPPIGLV